MRYFDKVIKNKLLNYYNLTIIGSPLGEFTYHSSQKITVGAKVTLLFRNREKTGVVLSSCEKPDFKTSEILEVMISFTPRNS